MQWGSHHDQTHLTYNQHTSKKKKKNLLLLYYYYFFLLSLLINLFFIMASTCFRIKDTCMHFGAFLVKKKSFLRDKYCYLNFGFFFC